MKFLLSIATLGLFFSTQSYAASIKTVCTGATTVIIDTKWLTVDFESKPGHFQKIQYVKFKQGDLDEPLPYAIKGFIEYRGDGHRVTLRSAFPWAETNSLQVILDQDSRYVILSCQRKMMADL